MGGSGFFKGEKKKTKKDTKGNKQISISTAPTFTLPKVITTKKTEK